MLQFNEDPDFFIERFSKDVQTKFCEISRIKYGHQGFIPAIKAYNEYIRDPYHTHLNSTRWATLYEFMNDLEEQGILEIVKEVDGAGIEQILIRMIDKDQTNKYALKGLNTKESARDIERKREQKDLDKMIKQANKMQHLHQLKGVKVREDEEVKSNTKIITFEAPTLQIDQVSELMIKPVVKAQSKIFGLNLKEEDRLDLSLLLKYKKSNLDKLLEHTGGMSNKIVNILAPSMLNTEWVRAGLIVKIKKEGYFDKIKGEVIKVISADKIVIKMFNDNREKEFKEKDLAKVLPSEGGRIYIFTLQRIATITFIDIKNQEVTANAGEAEGVKEIFKVKFNDLCKVNQ